MRWPLQFGRDHGKLQVWEQALAVTASSVLEFGYLAQPLKRQLSSVRSFFVAVDEDGAIIARPTAVCRRVEEFDGCHLRAGFAQNLAGFLLRFFVGDENADFFDARKMADDFAINPGNGRELAGPIGGFMRPREPGGVMRFPLGRHAEVGFLHAL